MIRKIATTALLVSTMAVNVFAYDTDKAKEFDKFYSSFTQKACANSTLYIEGDEVMKMMRKQKKFMFLDIRTPGELAVVGIKTSNTLEIPVEHLFEAKNLDRLPKDEPIVVVCYSGTRAVMAVASLKMIGFTNTRVMKGGVMGLSKASNTKTAPVK